jgi:ABC-type multidrug transport system fused ATPase/permease subunit
VGAEVRAEVAAGLLDEGATRGGTADVARVVAGVRAVEHAVEAGALGSVRAAVQLVPLVGVLVALAPVAAAVAVGVLTPFAIVLSRLRQSVRTGERTALDRASALDEQVDELVRHVDLWRTFGSGARVREALRTAARRATEATAAARTRSAALSGVNEVLAATALVVVLWAASTGVVPLDASTVVPFAAVFFLAYRPLRDLGDARAATRAGNVALAHLADLRGSERDEPHTSAPVWAPAPLALTEFGGARTSRRVSAVVDPGEIVALVGPTGSGKTTLLRALLGLDRSAGGLRYGDDELSTAAVGPHARPFAWVPQDAPVVAGTLDANLDLAAAPEHARDELSRLAGDAFASDLGEARLGSSGRPLSGGERAWVSLARALATGQPVLLLDEPTASLDAAAEARFLTTLGRLRGHRTVILVTHRSTTAAAADRVIALV